MLTSAAGLLQTKLTPPLARVDRVPRPRLTQQFNASLEHPLTLVCAPAGYGKTTLLGEWLTTDRGSAISTAWLSLDEDDNDSVRFLTYLIAAFVRVSSLEGDEVLSLLQTPQPPPPKVVITALISRLETCDERFALVLDDYHVISAQPIHEAITFLLDHLPQNISLVMSSREDPPFPLARLRGRGQLAEIRADELRFTVEEAGQFLGHMLGIQLSAEQIMDLDTRTEGWIAGLQLAALAMKGRDDVAAFIAAFSGSHRYILDYLTEEVLRRQPEHIQRFLRETSILNRMNGDLCDAVTGTADGRALLEQIEHGNLFLISLDDERYWYRYHHLFSEMLRRQLQRLQPDKARQLHQRASIWLEQNGWITEAVEHALSGGDGMGAARLIEHYGERLRMRGELGTVLRWLKALPEVVLRMHPRLGLNYAFMLNMTDGYAEAERRVLEVERALLDERLDMDRDQQRALLGQAAAVRATIFLLSGLKGDLTIAIGNRALALLPESDLYWRAWTNATLGVAHFTANGEMVESERCLKDAIRFSEESNDTFTLMVGLSQLARMYMIRGNLRQAKATAERLLRHGAEPRSRAQARLDRSYVRYEENDLQGALEDVSEARPVFEGYELKRFIIDGCVTLARLKWLHGDAAQAETLMQRAVTIAATDKLKQTFVSEDVWQAWLWLKLGNLSAAAEWAQRVAPMIQDDLDPMLEFAHITVARVWLAQGRMDETQDLLARLHSAANSAGRTGRVIVIRVLQALTAARQADTDRAINLLENALKLAEPEGYIRTFVDEGAPMEELLRNAKARGVAVDYVTKLLSALDRQASAGKLAPNERRNSGAFEALSERELEVLELLAGGASNREIAGALVVSLGTVKKHLNNIFLKLDAHSRTQAIAAARRESLLPVDLRHKPTRGVSRHTTG